MNNLAVYTDVDTLLDTRLIVRDFIDKELSYKELTSGNYHKRVTENFGNYGHNEFMYLYNSRDERVLEAEPIRTNVFKFLTEFFISALSVLVSEKVNGSLKLYINISPYEDLDLAKSLVNPYLLEYGLYEKIDIIFLTDEPDITWFTENITEIILYNGLDKLREWTTLDVKTLVALNEISFNMPAIFNPNDFLVNGQNNNKKELLDLIVSTFEKITDIHFLDTKTFCI